MGWKDLLVILGLALLVGLAFWFYRRRKKKGKGCCSDCSGCRFSEQCGHSPTAKESNDE